MIIDSVSSQVRSSDFSAPCIILVLYSGTVPTLVSILVLEYSANSGTKIQYQFWYCILVLRLFPLMQSMLVRRRLEGVVYKDFINRTFRC